MARSLSASSMVKPQQRGRLAWAISDSMVLIRRSLTHIFRNMDQLLGVAFMPIMFTLLFRYVFGGAINTGGVSYVNYLIAGILVQSAGFGATTTAVAITMDMKRGLIDRLRSLPTMTSAVLVGHTVSDLVRNTISSTIMVLVGLAVGFRPTANLQEWLMAAGIILLFTFAMSWISVIMGLIAKSQEAVQWITFVTIFPLTFASSAFVPAATMPHYLRVFAENQPVTQVVEAVRAWLVGTPLGNYGWRALIWCLGMLIVGIAISSYMFRHRNR